MSNVRNILRVIDTFCKYAAQCINFSKSNFIARDNIPPDLHFLVSEKEFSKHDYPIKYLGFFNIPNARHTRMMQNLVDKISHKVDSWTIKPLSHAGKSVMLKSVYPNLHNCLVINSIFTLFLGCILPSTYFGMDLE